MSTSYVYNLEQHKQLKQIINLVRSGVTPIVVVNDEIFEDCYLEKGMKAKLIWAELESNDVVDGFPDEVFMFTLDFKDFDDFNMLLESQNFRDPKTGLFNAKASDIGYKPNDLKETVIHSITHGKIFFDLIENDKTFELIKKYNESHFKGSYIEWLESQIVF